MKSLTNFTMKETPAAAAAGRAKSLISSSVAAILLLLLPALRLSTGSAAFDIAVGVALLFVIAYMTRFPFSPADFSATGTGEKMLIAPLLAFANAMAVLIVPALIAFSLHLTIGQLMYLYLFSFLAVQLVQPRDAQGVFVRDRAAAKESSRHELLNAAFWVSVGITLALGIHYGCWLSGDYTWHGTYIRKLRELSPLQFRNYLVADLPFPQYGHNIWHLFLALLSFITGRDAAQVWVNSNVFLPLLRIAAYYVFGKELFRSAFWGKVSVIVMLAVSSFLGMGADGETPLLEHKWSWDVPYPAEVAREVFVLLFLTFLFRGIHENRLFRKEIFFLSLCVTLTHFYYMFQLAFVLGILFLASFVITSEESKRYRAHCYVYLPLLIPAIAYMGVYKQLIDSPIVNPWFATPEIMGDWRNRIVSVGSFPLIHPWKGFLKNPLFALFTAALIPVLFSLKKKVSFWKVYLVAVPFGIAFMFFNPPFLQFLQKLNPGLDRIWRLTEIVPLKFAFVGALYVLQEEYGVLKKGAVAGILIAGLLLLFPLILKYQRAIVYTSAMWQRTAEQHARYKAAVERHVPAGSYVFADPQIAWTWPTIMAHYLYIHPFPAGLPSNFDPTGRLALWRSFFEKPVTDEVMKQVAESGIDHLVLTRQTFERKKDEIARYREYLEPPIPMDEVGLVAIKMRSGHQHEP